MDRTTSIIKEYRIARGLSQAELAEKCGVNTSYIGHLERGERKPSFDLLRCLVNELNIDANLLLYDTYNPTDPTVQMISTISSTLSSSKLKALLNIAITIKELKDE